MDSSVSKPNRIGAYDIVDVIGRGGMGTVFRGTDPRIGRTVAIKMLTAAADDPDLLERFYREAKYTGNLHHQNIVTVYELGHQDGVPYLVMEYLEGVSLEGVIASGRPMPIAEKLGIVLQVCSGLTYAHKQNLVHRDIKPANIVILADGTAKIVDFGIALLGDSQLTRTGHVVGSLNYMSPEQLNGNMDVDARTDVYSTGVVLFQLLTGALPFDGGSTAATLRKIVQDPPPLLSKYLTDCSEELEGILQKALAKNRDERYPSPEDFALDLAQVQQEYLQKIVGESLQQATDALHRNDFVTARQQVSQVLRGSPQNIEAAELLRHIKQAQEKQHQEQQVLHLQMKAEECFRKHRLDEALQYVEQGMRLDPEGAVFPGLRDAIHAAHARMDGYRAALRRAESAVKAGDLDAAKRAVEEAQAIVPDDAAARTLATQIIKRLEEKLREQKAGDKQRQFAHSVNAAEKGMADARMLLLLGQVPESLQVLKNMEKDVAQLPPRWREQFEALKNEVREKKEEMESPTQEFHAEFGEQTQEIPARFGDTGTMQPVSEEPDLRSAEPAAPADLWSETPSRAPSDSRVDSTRTEPVEARADSRGFTPVESGGFAGSDVPPDVLYPRGESDDTAHAEVAPELREFLEPLPTTWPRKAAWVGLAVVLLAALVWIFVKPRPVSEPRQAPAVAAPVGSLTYAEINAEPWATVTGITPASEDVANVIGQTTPLRVKLPPGQYRVTLQGPNRQTKQIDITVPQQGGVSGFAIFKKPDLGRIVGK
jgi:serine/threonine protein kinase